MSERITLIEMALAMAEATSKRSEDPFTKVGAVVVNTDKRIIATGYNGLKPGFKAPNQFWEDRDMRLKFMIHAEMNALSYVTRNDQIKFLACTHSPCHMCMPMIIAHGVPMVVFRELYHRDPEALAIAKFYGINLIWAKRNKKPMSIVNLEGRPFENTDKKAFYPSIESLGRKDDGSTL
jgi:dCMP deaminase